MNQQVDKLRIMQDTRYQLASSGAKARSREPGARNKGHSRLAQVSTGKCKLMQINAAIIARKKPGQDQETEREAG